jgi:hypothetical protein
METTLSAERLDGLSSYFWEETNDADTQKWRDALTPEESALIDEWDKKYYAG